MNTTDTDRCFFIEEGPDGTELFKLDVTHNMLNDGLKAIRDQYNAAGVYDARIEGKNLILRRIKEYTPLTTLTELRARLAENK